MVFLPGSYGDNLGDNSEIAESIKQHDWLFQAGLPT
jgi:hypothetical protein